MKRSILAFVILAAGTGAFCGLQTSTGRLLREARANQAACQTQIQLLANTRTEGKTLNDRVEKSEHELDAVRQVALPLSAAKPFVPGPGERLSPSQSEDLLAELGFDWSTVSNYVIVSKATLNHIRLSGMNGQKLSDAACKVLAITPQERGAIDAMTQQLGADYKAWAEAHVQRTEPSGDLVAQYRLPVDPEFSQSQSKTFMSGILATLGDERGRLLMNYSRSWMVDLGMDSYGVPPSPTTMTVRRHGTGDDLTLTLEVKQAGGGMQTVVSPWQPFPAAFRPLFPGGWQELARREGFELPAAFQKAANGKTSNAE